MAEVTAVKIPPYDFSDPQLWFSTCERTFALGVPKSITDTCTKFNYIVSNLPPEPPLLTPQESESACSFTQRSERAYVRTFFLQQLQTSVQTILASITPITVEKAAEVADRILEVSTSNVSFSTKRHRFIQRKPYPPRDCETEQED
ncbi:transposon Tf2-9 polyprotein [Trichonephila clavipes]|nr:transposon Tf2-9 polyprotein [Trichonephila clavipes]